MRRSVACVWPALTLTLSLSLSPDYALLERLFERASPAHAPLEHTVRARAPRLRTARTPVRACAHPRLRLRLAPYRRTPCGRCRVAASRSYVIYNIDVRQDESSTIMKHDAASMVPGRAWIKVHGAIDRATYRGIQASHMSSGALIHNMILFMLENVVKRSSCPKCVAGYRPEPERTRSQFERSS